MAGVFNIYNPSSFDDPTPDSPPGSTGPVPSPLYRKLDTNGDGTGTTNANGDYDVDTMVGARWTFSKACYPLRLDGDNNERLEVILNDDFATNTEIEEHYFFVQGYIEPTS